MTGSIAIPGDGGADRAALRAILEGSKRLTRDAYAGALDGIGVG